MKVVDGKPYCECNRPMTREEDPTRPWDWRCSGKVSDRTGMLLFCSIVFTDGFVAEAQGAQHG